MRRNSITFKLFTITAAFFILFLVVVAVSQSIFFESFYLQQKIKRLEKNVEEFAVNYEREDWDTLDITKNISRFVNNNNSQLAILNDRAAAKHLPSFNIVIETEDKKSVVVLLNNINMVQAMQQLKPTVGATIEVEGVYTNNDEKVLYPYSIEGKGSRWEALRPTGVSLRSGVTAISDTIEIYEAPYPVKLEAANPITVSAEGAFIAIGEMRAARATISLSLQQIKGRVLELNYPQQEEYAMAYREDMLWSALDYWFWASQDKDFEISSEEIISYKYTNPLNGINSIVMIKPIFTEGYLSEMIFAMSSLQPVGEAIEVMKDYYIYGIIGAIIIIILLSYIYSRLVANPLIKINNAALRMANLDFSVECDISSEDEIGKLANSINVLASSLNKNMRTLQDTNERLKLEIEKERGLERMRKEFVSSVSHELKTPLGIMRGFTEGLKDEVAIEKKDYYIDTILDEIQRMDSLVLDMLELSRLESKAYPLTIEDFNIYELVRTIEGRFIQQLEEKNIGIEYRLESEDILVHGDEKRIQQVITNIFSNAIRHVWSNGYIRIDIRRLLGNRVYIAIENKGDNIPKEKLKLIWDRFYRAEEARDRRTGGTGLGLSIVKNILELHNSEFGAINTETGVRFFFTLKKADEAGESDKIIEN